MLGKGNSAVLLAGHTETGFLLGSVATDDDDAREIVLPLGDEMALPKGGVGDHGNNWINELALAADGTVFVPAGNYLFGFDPRTRAQVFREPSNRRMTAGDRASWKTQTAYWHCHGYYCSVDVSTDQRLLAVGTQRGRVHLYDAGTRRWQGELGAAVARADQLVIAGESTVATLAGGSLTVWSLAETRPAIAREPMAWATQIARSATLQRISIATACSSSASSSRSSPRRSAIRAPVTRHRGWCSERCSVTSRSYPRAAS